MKKYLTMILTILPLISQAEVITDTTFVYGDKQIVVADSKEGTDITVLTKDGEKYTKTSETKFVDDQEVTQVYVTSPFLPNNWKINKSRTFYSHIPLLTYGMSTLGNSAMAFGDAESLHAKGSRSWDFSIGILSAAAPINRQHTFGLSVGIQLAWIKHKFADNYALYNDDGTVNIRKFELDENDSFKKSYISYMALRIPIYLDYQKKIGHNDFFFTLGPALEWRLKEHSRYKTKQHTITPTKDININPIGINLDVQVGYAEFAVFMRTALTPLMNTSCSPKAYPTSIGLAIGF